MTCEELLGALKAFTEDAVRDLMLPTRVQKGDDPYAPTQRAAEVWEMRLQDSSAAAKKTPYIIHQIAGVRDRQKLGEPTVSTVEVRSVFCVYNEDEREGALSLLTLIDRVRLAFLRERVVANRYLLDLRDGLEVIIYPEDSHPYYAGEMASVWESPTIEREVNNL